MTISSDILSINQSIDQSINQSFRNILLSTCHAQDEYTKLRLKRWSHRTAIGVLTKNEIVMPENKPSLNKFSMQLILLYITDITRDTRHC